MKTIEREVMTRQEALERYPNLSKANLSGADLSEANLSRANLSKANLSGANLSRANLSRTYLSEANLSEAKGIIRISGTRHEVFSTTKGIWVGCLTFDFKTWKDEVRQIGRDNGYTQDQIREYKEYLELCTGRFS